MSDPDIRGLCPPRFSAVREAFTANFAEGLELGARFALAIEGRVIVELIGGWADRAQSRPFADDTLTPLFSTSKALAALMIARLVDEDRLDYGQKVAEIWPEFAAAGKGELTVGQVMAHQAGLPGFLEPMAPSAWFDWRGVCQRLGTMTPMWSPGTASGYHAVTFGSLAGENFRRVDGRGLGVALREDIAAPVELDLWLGLPDSEHGRVADMRRPPAMPDLGPMTEIKRAAFFTKWASPGGVSQEIWRRAAIPSVTGHATAPALARLMAILPDDGMPGGARFLGN